MGNNQPFEFRVDDGGLPGVFLPREAVVRGLLSAATYERWLLVSKKLDDYGRQRLLHRAVHRRFKINGVGIGMIDVTPADITAAFSDYEESPRPVTARP